MLILLFAILAGFDIYNAIRAKLKVETAQESAALAGAVWQKNSLNLIGELNMLKACAVLLEDDNYFQIPLPSAASHPGIAPEQLETMRREAIQSRIDVITEMQSRVSFMGPLVGFAAAQQAAKANGIPTKGNIGHYVQMLKTNPRYRWDLGRAPRYINNFEWLQPYTGFVELISSNGIAVFPNARTSYSPSVYPSQLAYQSFYDAILRHQSEIEKFEYKAVPYGKRSGWKDMTHAMVYKDTWKERFASPPWWRINYSVNAFPSESEIFTLGVATSIASFSEVQDINNPQLQSAMQYAAKLNQHENKIQETFASGNLIDSTLDLNFFYYDRTWYPQYYRSSQRGYDANHYNYWFMGKEGGSVLRKKIKPQYRYEGPAAYVETFADVGRTTSIFRLSGQKRYNSESHSRIGSDRDGDSGSELTEYRPGTIAKVLGELNNDNPPIALPVVLPVFDKVSIMPTYMPIPYGFGVLRNRFNALDIFLAWLSNKDSLEDDDLNNPLPAACQNHLLALLYLCEGEKFRYYGWNPDFDETAFASQWKGDLASWHQARLANPDTYQYSPTPEGKNNPGYLQEPQIFSITSRGSGIVKVTDHIHGGTAERHYLPDGGYLVVDGRGRIVTNNDTDPTIDYSTLPPTGGGGGGFTQIVGGYDDQKGPVRL